MSERGICLLSYLPLRGEPRSGAEMVSSLLFGETYTLGSFENDFIHIRSDFDAYEGWISAGSHHAYQEGFSIVNEHVFIEAKAEHQILFLPCASMLPESGTFKLNGHLFTLERKLKNSSHLPLKLRLQKLALAFMNTPYLWGGRSFMGIDCSGLTQVVFKANGIALPRDSSQQLLCGTEVRFEDRQACDLVFFSKPDSEKITHVGIQLEKEFVIHASGMVRKDLLDSSVLNINGVPAYTVRAVRRIV